MRKSYILCTGPVMVPIGEDGNYQIVVPPTEHRIYGRSVKYVAAPDAAQVQILDAHGDIVFATAVNMLLWLKVVQSVGEMVSVVVDETVDVAVS